jgi:hypothetical protein
MSVVKVDARGTERWYDPDGALHREDGPTVKYANGTKFWYLHGKLHRVDGPAEEWADGTKKWHFEGKLHRDGGPAAVNIYGRKFWYQHGKLHRVDGPAMEWPTGSKYWYFEGHKITESQSEFIQRMHQKAFRHKFKLLRYLDD